MKKLLLTAFDPFGGQSINSSLEAARAIQNHTFHGLQVKVLQIPVERFKALQMTLDAMAHYRPDIVIMLGEAGGRAMITPERVAINVDDYPIPDNAGNQPREETIVANGPAAYFSTLPIVAIRDAILAQRLPAAISNSAGTYLCNSLSYGVLHHLSETKSPVRAGFIHVPMLPEQRYEGAESWPSLPRETILHGIRIAIQTCALTC